MQEEMQAMHWLAWLSLVPQDINDVSFAVYTQPRQKYRFKWILLFFNHIFTCVRVCLSVCLSVRGRFPGLSGPIFFARPILSFGEADFCGRFPAPPAVVSANHVEWDTNRQTDTHTHTDTHTALYIFAILSAQTHTQRVARKREY